MDRTPSRTPDQRKRASRLIQKIRQQSLPRLQKYEQPLKILGERNSLSKTDPE